MIRATRPPCRKARLQAEIYRGATNMIIIKALTIDLNDILPIPLFQISPALFYKDP
jgi:hypothetical protein